MSESNTLHFYHHKCELKLVNNITSSIRFFQESIHEEKDFAPNFCIHIIPELRPYKWYNYLDFFQFFKLYQIHKLTYDLDIGRAFYAYLSEADTEICTTLEKFNDPEGKYKGVIDNWVYFIVNPDGQYVLVLIKTKHLREFIYSGMKDNVTNCGLKSFHTECEYLDNKYWDLNIKALQGTMQPLTRSLFRLDLI